MVRRVLAAAAALLCLAGISRGADVVVLDTRSAWRLHETWQTEVARRAGGALVRIDPYKPREDLVYEDESVVAGKYTLRETKTVRGSSLPAERWRDAAFDDRDWTRQHGAFNGYSYRALALLCVRGKFEVTDPAKAGEMSLAVTYQGGIVAYLNGKEIGRANLPEGNLEPFALAEDYPRETFCTDDGTLIQQGWYRGRGGVASYRIPKDLHAKWMDGFKKRSRTLEVKVPASLLGKGTNVLAFEIHRAPAPEIMFITIPRAGSFDRNIREANWWNRCGIESVTLSAPSDAGVTPNTKRPAGLRVWNHPVFQRVEVRGWADPNETLAPVRLVCPRNGVASGKVVVSSTGAVDGLEATVTELAGAAGARIAATQLAVRCPRYELVDRREGFFDALDDAPAMTEKRDGNTQPVWVTVRVPKDARPGDYRGTLTVSVKGEAPVAVPVELTVADWTLPDPHDFTTHVGIVQSPETVAMQYKVPMWSDAHMRLMGKSFALMAETGAKTIYIPVKCRTHFGNSHSMVRWVREPDGSHKIDFSIVEKYLDLAVAHLGKVPVVCLAIYDGGPSSTRADAPGTFVTELDPVTPQGGQAGALAEMKVPDWGTPESRAFWQPVFDGMREILRKRGLEKSLMVGLAQSVQRDAVADLKAVAPEAPWVAHSHLYSEEFGRAYQAEGQPVGYLAQVGGTFSVFWDPEEGRPFYGWRNPFRVTTYPRDDSGAGVGPCLRFSSELMVYRLAAEGAILSGRQDRYPTKWGARVESMALKDKKAFPGIRGIGRLGADFWPVLKGKRASEPICGRYPGSDWGTLNLKWVVPYLFAAGPDGAISTVRYEMFRESLQEAEARIFVQDALLDDNTRGKLGPALADRLEKQMTERTRALRYISEFAGNSGPLLLTPTWRERSKELYEAAAEVARALGKEQ